MSQGCVYDYQTCYKTLYYERDCLFLQNQILSIMIQRIQTIFLLLAAIVSMMVFVFPLASYFSDLVAMQLFLTGPVSLTPGTEVLSINVFFSYFLAVLNAMAGFIALYAMLKYKQRLFQLKLVKVSLLLNIVLLVVLFVLCDFIKSKLNVSPEYGLGIIFPIISIVLLLLAQRGIKKDEAKVKSTSRIR